MTRVAKWTFLRYSWLALLLVMTCQTLVWACPNCRDALAGDPAQAGLVRGFFWSILFMLSMPFLILGGLSTYFYWEVCRARRAAAVAAAAIGSHLSADDAPTDSPVSHVDEMEPVGAS